MNQTKDERRKLENYASTFFHKFARFEFALKERGFIAGAVDTPAMPNWTRFTRRHSRRFQPSKESLALVQMNPHQQYVTSSHSLGWRAPNFGNGSTPLHRTVVVLKTVRNNVFHGGKSDKQGWNAPDRTTELLRLGILALDQLADLDEGIYEDYFEKY